MKPMLTALRLREVLDYDAATGGFRWRVSRGPAKGGDGAGCIGKDGSRRICVAWHDYLASRLAWLYVHDCWPENEIDHKNTIPRDDRLQNLRDVTSAGNKQNKRRARTDNKLGMLGVSLNGKNFGASIGIDGGRKWLGTFETPEGAQAAVAAAKRNYNPTWTLWATRP